MDCFSILLILFNVIFTMAGIAEIGIGIWTAADKIYVSSLVGDTLFSTASYLLIAVGVVTLCVCIFGIYAVIKKQLRLIIIYFGALVLAAVLMLVAAIIAVAFKGEMEGAMVDQMRKTLLEGYGKDNDVTDSWNKVQEELKCCAISKELVGKGSGLYSGPYADGTLPDSTQEEQAQDSFAIYKRTEWFRKQEGLQQSDKTFVPKSCCIFGSEEYLSLKDCQNFAGGPPTNYKGGLRNNYIYYDGCYEKAKSLVMDQTDILVAIGFIFVFIMIGGIVLTILVYRRIKSDNDDDLKRRREPDNL